jgi:hypothetical protein
MTKLLLALCLLAAACGSNPAAPVSDSLHIPPPVVFKPCCSSDSLPKHWKPWQ